MGTAIKTINLNNVESVSAQVFKDCDSLEIVRFATTGVSVGEDAFAYIPSKCTVALGRLTVDLLNWQSVRFSPHILVQCDGAIGWCGDGGDSPQDFLYWKQKGYNLTIECTQQGIDNYPDKQIIKTHRWLDYMPSNIAYLTLKNVYAIGKESFKGMNNLEKVNLNDGLTSIGESAFEDCTRMKFISIPASVTSIGNKAFANCTSLKSITIPSSVTSIGNKAFWECTSLKYVNIEGNPTIAEDAFPDGARVKYVKE